MTGKKGNHKKKKKKNQTRHQTVIKLQWLQGNITPSHGKE
jgi:hypothetical protein